MNKAYFIAPLIALLVFGGFHWSFRSGYQERQEARQAAIRAEREASLAAESEARRKAIEEAVTAQEQRKKERAEKEAADQARKAARQEALDARDAAFREREKINRQLEATRKELAEDKAALAKLEETRKATLAEQAFLEDYVAKIESNAKALETVIPKIEAASQARAAAAATAKKNS